MKTKFIQRKEDLTFNDDKGMVECIENAENGAIELQVIDNGVGIKKANMNKLFKLFGFLEDTK